MGAISSKESVIVFKKKKKASFKNSLNIFKKKRNAFFFYHRCFNYLSKKVDSAYLMKRRKNNGN